MKPRFFYTLPTFDYIKGLFAKQPTLTEKVYPGSYKYPANTARAALRLLLSSISAKKLRVGVQAYTCHTVFQAIHNAGHEIVFLDLSDNLELDIGFLSQRKVDVLIVTHTFGIAQNIHKIKLVLNDPVIIEDCSHAFLTSFNDQYCGTFGDASIFSFGLGKFPPVGSGGLCVVNRPEKFPTLEKEYSRLKYPGSLRSIKQYLKIFLYSIFLKPPFYGMLVYRIGKKLDTKLDFTNKNSFVELRGFGWSVLLFENNLMLFHDLLNKSRQNSLLLDSLILAEGDNQIKNSNYYIYHLLVKNRDLLYKKLLDNNIEAGCHFARSIEWAKEFGYKDGMCPNCEKIIKSIITLPVHPGMKKKTINKIAKIVNEELSKK